MRGYDTVNRRHKGSSSHGAAFEGAPETAIYIEAKTVSALLSFLERKLFARYYRPPFDDVLRRSLDEMKANTC